MTPVTEGRQPRTWATYVPSVLGIALLVLMAPLYFSAGLSAPWWAMILLFAVWLALLIYSTYFFSKRPLLVLAFPFIAAAWWILLVIIGGSLLNWTA